MSTGQHTKGRIKAKQTELLLEAGRYRMASRITACGSATGGADEVEVAMANARRLAACWNACEGISTGALEAGSLSAAFEREKIRADKAETQRGEMLAALQAMSAHYSGSLDHQPPYVKLGRAAIAKAAGGGA